MKNFPEYRLWVPEEKKMYYGVRVNPRHLEILDKKDSDVIFMQGNYFNGVRVFEGDLIKGDNYGPYLVWLSDSGTFLSCCYRDEDDISKYRTIEVVGNPMENPEIEYEGQQFDLDK